MKRKNICITVLVFIMITGALISPAKSNAGDYEIAGGGGINCLNRLQSKEGILLGAWINRLDNMLDLRIEPNMELIETGSGKWMFMGGVSPILRLGTHGHSLNPFLDAGAGVSIGSKKQLEQRDLGGWNLGGYFFFSPTAGAGVKIGKSEKGISLFARFVHHSNANLFPHNQSLNFLDVLLGYRF